MKVRVVTPDTLGHQYRCMKPSKKKTRSLEHILSEQYKSSPTLRHSLSNEPNQHSLSELSKKAQHFNTSSHVEAAKERLDTATPSAKAGEENFDASTHSVEAVEENFDTSTHPVEAVEENFDTSTHSV